MMSVESDGMKIINAVDPPGQMSAYIAPGDCSFESYRLSTFHDFPHHVPVDPRLLARFGFLYTGFKDRVKCFSCGINIEQWKKGDDPTDSKWHDRGCQQLSNPPSNADSNDRFTLFPCHDPVNPHMQYSAARLQTFVNPDRLWTSDRPTSIKMVDAGFFYLGERDRVKCWYCNGGLQNWNSEDDPFFEHAKWYPMCDYVLQQKGPEYVYSVTLQFPNILRPEISDLVNINHFESCSGVTIIDPREELSAIIEKVENEIRTSVIAKEAQSLGFNQLDVKIALLNQHLEKNLSFSSLEALVDAILSLPPSVADQSRDNDEANTSSGNDLQDIAQKVHHLEQTRLCRKCKQNEATVVLLPCGHLVVCVTCSSGVTLCPICRLLVRNILPVAFAG